VASADEKPPAAPPPARRKAALIQVLTNYGSTAFLIGKGLLLVPLYLSSFGAEGYGAWLASGNVLSLISTLESGFTTIFAQRLSAAFGEKDMVRFGRTLASGGAILGGVALAAAALAAIVAGWVPAIVRADLVTAASLPGAFALAGLGFALTLLQTVVYSVFLAWLRPLIVGVIKLVVQAIEMVAIIAGLKAGFGLYALGGASVLSGLAGLAIVAVAFAKAWRAYGSPRPRVDGAEMKLLFAQTVPLFTSRVGSAVLNNNEPLIVSAMLGPGYAAVIGLTDRVFKVGQMLVNPIAGSVFYGLAHLGAEDREGARLRSVTAEVLGLAGLLSAMVFGVAAALNAPFMALWVGPGKFGGFALSAGLALSSVVVVRTNLLGMMLAALGMAGQSAWCSLVEVVVRVPLMFLLLGRLGLVGLPVAVVASNTLVTGWYCSAILCRRLSLRGAPALRLAIVGLFPAVGATVAGIALAARLPPATGWRWFCVEAGLLSLASAVVLLIASAQARGAARQALRWVTLRARRGAHA
jgi:O-antigen/teichoic acid export membrane protein